MKKISELVNILYCNIDSILITESDFKILENAGYIGDDLGKFKVEHVFKEFCIQSPRKWIATTIDNLEVKRPRDLDMTIEELAKNIE